MSSKAESPNHLTLITSVGPFDNTPLTRAPVVRLSRTAISTFLLRVALIIPSTLIDNQLKFSYSPLTRQVQLNQRDLAERT